MHKKCNEAVNGGDFWKTVKPLISNRGINKDDNIFLSYDGEIVNNTNDICRIFNNYFTHMGIGQIRRHIGDANLAGNN